MGALASSQYPLCTIILAAVDRISGAFQKHLDILYPLVLSFTIFFIFYLITGEQDEDAEETPVDFQQVRQPLVGTQRQ